MTQNRPFLAAVRGSLAAILSVLPIAWPSVVFAQLTVNPYVSAQVEHDSNVFRLPNSATAAIINGDPTLADTDERYLVGVDGTYLWSRQKLTANFEGREIRYQHFDDLNHSEYLGNLVLNWKLLSSLDGIVQVRQERTAAAFANRNSNTLTLDIDRQIVGRLNYTFTPDWRLETGLTSHTLDAPLQFYPDFVEHETTTHVGVSYLGVANLTFGGSFEHLDGNYSHAIGVGPYKENTEQFNVIYKITGLSSFNGALGYSTRDQTLPAGSFSAVTGNLGYNRQLTGKTSVSFQVVRAVNSYVAAGGSEVDTSATAGVVWAATYKISLTANAGYLRSVFEGQVIPGSVSAGRVDRTPTETLNIVYKPLKRLEIKGYVQRQTRSSTYEIDSFDDTLVGINVKASWR